MAPRSIRTDFGEALAAQMRQRDVSVRELARRMRPDDPEAQRRSIARWLAPRDRAVNPSRASRVSAAEALGLSPDAFAAPDDEEDHPVAVLRAVEALVGLVRIEVEAGVARQLSMMYAVEGDLGLGGGRGAVAPASRTERVA